MKLEYAIELNNITMRFGDVVANNQISFKVEKGEIHALSGENGAGKTTLMNIIYGLYTPTEGQLTIHGKQVKFSSSKDAIACGVGMVHQHFMLVPRLTVAENIMVGQEIGSALKLDRKKAAQVIGELSERYGLKIDPNEKVANLSVTMQQRVEILKILYRNADILIFDEPTAVLTPQEIDEFCQILMNLKKEGKTILFISHKLNEVMGIADHITVIRRGTVITTLKTSETNTVELTKHMVGREVKLGGGERKELHSDTNMIEIKDVVYRQNKELVKLNHLNLSVKAGEIMGIAGVDGNGQEELAQALAGIIPVESGEILYDGQSIKNMSIRQIKQMGVGYIPEDRHKDGLVLDFSIEENLILGKHTEKKFCIRKLFTNKKVIHENGEKLKDEFDIRCHQVTDNASTLSGGNQQKIVIAREVLDAKKAIIAVQPTRGLDVGAIEFVHKTLVEHRNKGKGIILFSLELDELLDLSDRIAVIYKGEIVGIVRAKETTKEELGEMMLGLKKGDVVQ